VVTATIQRRAEAQLAQPANPTWDSAASAFSCSWPVAFRTSLPSPVNATPLARISHQLLAKGRPSWH